MSGCACALHDNIGHTTFAIYFVAVLSLAVTPGPTVTLVTMAGMKERTSHMFALIAGILFVNFIYIIAASLFRAVGFTLPCVLSCLLPLFGATFLLLLGGRMLISTLKIDNTMTEQAPFRSKLTTSSMFFFRGLSVHGVNPNTLIFFSGIFMAIVPLDGSYLKNVAILGLYAIAVDALVLFSYWQIGTRISSIFRRHKLDQYSPYVAAILLIILAALKFAKYIPLTLTK